MKRLAIITILCLSLSMGACATFNSATSAPGCEKSFTTVHKRTFDIIMTATVVGLYALSAFKPAMYAIAHDAARAAITVLQTESNVTIGTLTRFDWASLLGVLELLGHFGADRYLDDCDKLAFIAYLRMI
jgi:hypothetical protein